jgi:hypothetical protein
VSELDDAKGELENIGILEEHRLITKCTKTQTEEHTGTITEEEAAF